jgi:hypothetical protein
MGFTPFFLENLHLYMAAIAWPGWPSYVKGAEFAVPDALALAIYLNLPNAPRPLPFRISMALYFFAVLLSAIDALEPEAAFFYVWQLARIFLVYAVTARASADPRTVPMILTGMAAALIIEAGFAIWQRFGLGMFQTTGSFYHQNLLGMMSLLVTFPFFALLLAGRKGWLPPLVLLAGFIVQILTVSRGTIGIAGAGYAAVFALSAMRRFSPRKGVVLLVALTTIAMVVPPILSSIERRGETQVDRSDASRVALNNEAAMLLSDHPLGVGANQYVIAARQGGYREIGADWAAPVHNVYWLVAAETGYIGLITFVVFLFCPPILALRCGWRYQGDPRADLLIGFGVALLTVYVQSLFEWVFLQVAPQYIFALEIGMVAGLARQLGYWGNPDPIGARPVSSQAVRRKVA